MDYGTLTDNTGRKTDFSNVILIMTSNAGAFEMSRSSIGFGEPSLDDAASKGLAEVEKLFTPEFRNRLNRIVVFHGMDEAMALSSLTGLEDLTCYSVWTSAPRTEEFRVYQWDGRAKAAEPLQYAAGRFL